MKTIPPLQVMLPVILLFFYPDAGAQISGNFELRYFTKDKSANGVTDFKGEREYFDTAQRIEFLERYAEVASAWFMDSALDRQVVEDAAVDQFLHQLKPQPLPEKRKKIVLDWWNTTGMAKPGNLKRAITGPSDPSHWYMQEGVSVKAGALGFVHPNVRIDRTTDTLQWRFHISFRAKSGNGNVPLSVALLNGAQGVAEAGFHANGNIFFTDNGFDRMGLAYMPGRWYTFRLEVDMENDRYNLYVDDELIGDWAGLENGSRVTGLRISGGRDMFLDDLWGLNFDTTGCDPGHPYHIKKFLLEKFDPVPRMENWQDYSYDDTDWQPEKLPAVRGGVLQAGEDLYLRKKVSLGEVRKAFLNIETLDPGGEVWINGEVVYVTHDRHPVRIDISEHLVPFRENQLAIRVYSSHVEGPLYHASRDRNIGWFCGRAWLDLSGEVYLGKTAVFTSELNGNEALQHHLTALVNDTDTTFTGSMEINYYPWFPAESRQKAVSHEVPVRIFARDSIHMRSLVKVPDPEPWTHDNPVLYKIHIRLRRNGQVVDDAVFTSGIRTISQEGGTFRINGMPELLGGAQTMGFRMPIENIARWNRCAPDEILAEELLSVKKLGNLLRIHVHAAGKYAYSVNDPRVAEMADQLGVMLIWPTTSWIREGEWGGIDFEGYPGYMKQVFNHPSIVIWEGSNHPNRFRGKPLEYSNRFITKMYRTIADTDSSRLIAPSSFNRHFAFRNDEGTINEHGDSIVPCAEWTAPLIVRGNQDALTGYGAEWHNIRKWPDPYRKSFLYSEHRAYINFEHEESIGMQNFSLARGKPWYQMPSYENPYDVGSIGRDFGYDEWRASQAWQAFSAYESMKWQRILDIDGFSWCCLHGGPNSGTYRKPIIDALGHAKLAFYTNAMVLQDVLACSNEPDVVYGKKDRVTPVILNVGEEKLADLKLVIRSIGGDKVLEKTWETIQLPEGRTVTELPPFRPKLPEEGYYIFEYYVLSPSKQP